MALALSPPGNPPVSGRKACGQGPSCGAAILTRLILVGVAADGVGEPGDPAGHGCVGRAKADVEKVARLVQECVAPGATEDVQDLVPHPSKTRTVWLDMPVAFRVAYAVAEVEDGRLLRCRDVYGSGRAVVREQVVRALVQSGEEPGALDQSRREWPVRRPGRRELWVYLDAPRAAPGAARARRAAPGPEASARERAEIGGDGWPAS